MEQGTKHKIAIAYVDMLHQRGHRFCYVARTTQGLEVTFDEFNALCPNAHQRDVPKLSEERRGEVALAILRHEFSTMSVVKVLESAIEHDTFRDNGDWMHVVATSGVSWEEFMIFIQEVTSAGISHVCRDIAQWAHQHRLAGPVPACDVCKGGT